MDDLIRRAELFDELNRRGVPYNAEVNMVINGMPSAQQWIPCSERLPEEDTYVLATTAWGEITMAEKLSDIAWFIYEGTANAKSGDIVAWMPLPEPYREDGEAK